MEVKLKSLYFISPWCLKSHQRNKDNAIPDEYIFSVKKCIDIQKKKRSSCRKVFPPPNVVHTPLYCVLSKPIKFSISQPSVPYEEAAQAAVVLPIYLSSARKYEIYTASKHCPVFIIWERECLLTEILQYF